MTKYGCRWYVVQTHANAEMRATSHLGRQGFDVYLPRYMKRRSHARKVDYVACPLFPRYLFVAFDVTRQYWQGVRSTVGIAHLVGSSCGPTPVPDNIVRDLKSREDNDGYIRLERKSPFLPGERVQVVKGAFSLCSGLFESMSDHERVAVLLDLMGRSVRVFLDRSSITAA